ncbi:MAG: EAL domain-containing protein [Campylobacterota bacterium]|nr:EAL domain-containing protein [Campylobacterota bacterium]
MYTEKIERVQRFKLALRMGIPIFFLTAVLFFSLLIQYLDSIPYKFIIIVVGLLAVSVYFQFYLIYQGFNERVTDTITHTFTREYFKKLFQKNQKKSPQTLILYSIKNLYDINERLGVKNGDKLLYDFAKTIDYFFHDKGVNRPIISHIKGGDFIIMLEGEQNDNRTLFEIFSAKVRNTTINGIEINSRAAMIDSSASSEYEKLLDRLFELQLEFQNNQIINEDDKTDLNILEKSVLEALKSKHFSVMAQHIMVNERTIVDITFKLLNLEGKLIHQKRFLPILTRLGLRSKYELLKIEFILNKIEETSNFCYTLNIAPDSLRDYKFQEQIKILLSKEKRRDFIFIIEEKEYFPNIKRYNALLQSYRDMGIKILIDGLGNNHTTQLYMKDLNVDMVRFDGSYGKKIKDTGYKNIIEGLNLTAKKMRLVTWIRMISDEESYNIAKEMDIDIISGNFLGKITSIKTMKKE